MKIVIDTQVRVAFFEDKLQQSKLLKKIKNKDNYIVINDSVVAVLKYNNKLDNEKVFNSYLIIDDIIIFIDLETRNYIAFRDGKEHNHRIFEEITKWVRMNYKKEKTRLLESMKIFREKLLNHKLTHQYYLGIHSDMFSVNMRDGEHLIQTWNQRHNKNILGVDENFSFFLKVCKLVL